MSNVAALLDQTRTAAHKHKAETDAKYKQLVHQAATGGKIDPEAVAAFLTAAGIEHATFEADVKLKCDRFAWRAEADTLPKLRADLETIHHKIAAANAQLEADVQAAREKYARALDPLDARQRKLQAAVRSAEQAEDRLLNVGADPTALERQAQAQKRRNDLIAEKARVEDQVRRAEAAYQHAAKSAEVAGGIRSDHPNPASRAVESEILARQASTSARYAEGLQGTIEEGRKRLDELLGLIREAAEEFERIGREAATP